MTDTRGEWRFLRFIGGVLLGLVVTGGALTALLIFEPADRPSEPAADVQAEAEPDAGTGAEEAGEPVAVVSPEVAPSDPSLPEPVPQPSADVNRQVQGALEPSQPAAEEEDFAAPQPFEDGEANGQLSGLAPAAQLEGPAPVVDVPQVEGPAFQLQGPALSLNAAPFEADGAPLVAVVLDDAASSELSPETLLSLPVPLTLGIVPRSQEAIDLAAKTRLENEHYEILAQLPVAPAGGADAAAVIRADMSDLEVAERVEEAMATLWMSVGASSLPREGGALDERIMRGVIAVLERNGFAFVNADAGTAEAGRAFAQAFSVPYAGQVRRIPADATAEEAYAALERAAADAAGGGPLIVSAPPSRAVLEAVWRWQSGQGGGSARIAPLSAVIRRMNQG
jgi:polysaccharide deacetylase 2 family uncharacterized protein YibQ